MTVSAIYLFFEHDVSPPLPRLILHHSSKKTLPPTKEGSINGAQF